MVSLFSEHLNHPTAFLPLFSEPLKPTGNASETCQAVGSVVVDSAEIKRLNGLQFWKSFALLEIGEKKTNFPVEKGTGELLKFLIYRSFVSRV